MIPSNTERIISGDLRFAGSNSGAIETQAAKNKFSEASFREKKTTKSFK